MVLNPALFLSREDKLALKAALGPSDDFRKTYTTWRSQVDLNNISGAASRLLPAIAQRAIEHDIVDSEMPRMKGIVRHAWLSNQLRARALLAALRALGAANIDAIILKGAALFARYPQMMRMRAPGDYDVLVRRRDASEAVGVFLSEGYRPYGPRLDRFQHSDFDLIHGGHFAKSLDQGLLDLHWRPLPSLNDESLVEELFSRSEAKTFGGHEVRVPSLADHLALTISRAATWDGSEFALRAAEAALLLKARDSALEWSIFSLQISRLRCRNTAWHMIDFISDQLKIRVSGAVLAKLGGWRAASTVRKYKALLPSDVVASIARSAQSQRQLALRRIHRARARCRFPIAKLRDRDLESAWERAAGAIATPPENKIAFLTGFSVPETEGRWTDGKLATLQISINPALSNIELRITVQPFVPSEGASFAFDLYSGRGTTRHYRLHRMVPTEITIERVPVIKPHRVVLALRLLDSASPALYGLSEDTRELGLLFYRIEIFERGNVVDCFEFGAGSQDLGAQNLGAQSA